MIFNGETFRSLLIEAEAELYEEDTNIRFKPSDRFKTQLNKKLKAENKERIYSFMSVKRNRILTVVIAVLLAASLAMSVGAIREAVFGFIINIFEDHSTVYTDRNKNDKPNLVVDCYAPAYVPEGYGLRSQEKTPLSYEIRWSDNEGNEIVYLQMTISAVLGYDTAKTIKTVHSDGAELYFYETERSRHVFWNDGNYIYSIMANLTDSEEELIKMTKSLQKTEFTKS